MNAPRKGPKVGSRAYLALVQLHKHGGQVDIADWMTTVSWVDSAGHFARVIVNPLIQFRLVFRRGEQLAFTERGLAFLGAAGDVAVPAPVITPAPYVAPKRPLSARHRPTVRVLREGAFDYRDIPSLQAGQRTAFKTSLQVNHG